MNIASYINPINLRQTELNSANESEDNVLAELCIEASREFESMCGQRIFYPYLDTKYFDHPDQKGHPNSTLLLHDDILQVTSLTTNNGADTLAAGDFFLRTGARGRYGETPYDRIELEYGSTGYATNFQWTDTPQRANAVTGFWGYVPGWTGAVATDSCWVSSGAAIQSVTSTTLVVDSLAGVNMLGVFPRVAMFDLVMWYTTSYATMEMGFVINVDEDSNTITLNRGVNGTTALSLTGTPTLYVYRPPRDIVHAVRRLAAFYYRQRQTSRTDIDRPIITQGGSIVMPSSLPKDIFETVQRYQGILE